MNRDLICVCGHKLQEHAALMIEGGKFVCNHNECDCIDATFPWLLTDQTTYSKEDEEQDND